jgi:hypothetical protein
MSNTAHKFDNDNALLGRRTQVEDILHHVVTKGILHQTQCVGCNFLHKQIALGRVCCTKEEGKKKHKLTKAFTISTQLIIMNKYIYAKFALKLLTMINAALEDTTAVSVGGYVDKVSCNRIKDKL